MENKEKIAFAEIIQKALKDFNNPIRLKNNQLKNHYLVQEKVDKGFELDEALRESLIEFNEVVAEYNTMYAFIIEKRYFEGLTINQLINGEYFSKAGFYEIAPRTISKYTNSAIQFMAEKMINGFKNEKISKKIFNKKIKIINSLLWVLFFLFFGLFILVNNSLNSSKIQYCDLYDSELIDFEVNRFVQKDGYSIFNSNNTNGIKNSKIRSLYSYNNLLLVGYFEDDNNINNSFSEIYWDEEKIIFGCEFENFNNTFQINSFIFFNDILFIATDGYGILSINDKGKVNQFTAEDGLASDSIYSFTIDNQNNLWASTSNGVYFYDMDQWVQKYDKVLIHNQIYEIKFDSKDNIYIGYIFKGMSIFDNKNGVWLHLNEENGLLRSNNVRGIEFNEDKAYIAFDGAGVAILDNEYEVDSYFDYNSGLISNSVNGIEFDSYGRIWVLTNSGTVYYDNSNWIVYNTLPSYSITFMNGCDKNDCQTDSNVWIATSNGITHSRLPYNDDAIEILRGCLYPIGKPVQCFSFSNSKTSLLEMHYSLAELLPGDSFYFEILIMPINNYELRIDRGDFLSFIGEENNLNNAYPIIPVNKNIATGETYIFDNRNNLIIIPENYQNNLNSKWKIWMSTRYTGPEIIID